MSIAIDIKTKNLDVVCMMVAAEEKFVSNVNKRSSYCFIYTFKDGSKLELDFYCKLSYATQANNKTNREYENAKFKN